MLKPRDVFPNQHPRVSPDGQIYTVDQGAGGFPSMNKITEPQRIWLQELLDKLMREVN